MVRHWLIIKGFIVWFRRRPMKKRKNTVAGIIIIVLGIALIAGVIIYVLYVSKDQPQYFINAKRAKGNLLLNSIRSYDLENGYPEIAEEVMELNSAIMHLYYGRIVSDNSLIRELVDTQRLIFDDVLLELNTAESQWEKIVRDAETLYNENVYIYQIDQGVAFYSTEQDMCIVPITITLINYEKVYWNYFLSLDDQGRWKIYTWQRTDKYFQPLEEAAAS